MAVDDRGVGTFRQAIKRGSNMQHIATDRTRDRFFAQLERRHEDHTILVKAIAVLRTRGCDPIAIAQLLRAVAHELESE
jgi:hypothetical protein